MYIVGTHDYSRMFKTSRNIKKEVLRHINCPKSLNLEQSNTLPRGRLAHGYANIYVYREEECKWGINADGETCGQFLLETEVLIPSQVTDCSKSLKL